MAFIDRLKDAYLTADSEVKRHKYIYNDNPSEDNEIALERIETEQKFIRNQFKPNGFDLDLEAPRRIRPIAAVKCEYCGSIFELTEESVKHVLDNHILEMLK